MPYKTLLILLIPLKLTAPTRSFYSLWNVGQGQWLSQISWDQCFHWDMGGEWRPQKVIDLCYDKNNFKEISHRDWDHISFENTFNFPTDSKAKHYEILYPLSGQKKWKGKNANSKVFLIENFLLNPGDSLKSQEKLWKHQASNTQILILGHHGSKTSTSDELLQSLTNLKWAMVSARERKYDHPHPIVVERLRKRKIPLLRTEDWGNIQFTLPNL